MEEPQASADVIPLQPLLSPDLANRNPVKGGPIVYTAVAQQDDPSSTWKPQASTTRYWARFALGTVWASEIASISFALIMFAAIVILLASRKDKPLPNWPSLLGINSLVAIFGSIFKVTLLYPIVQGISELKWIWFAAPRPLSDFDRFDAASRGPWGASKLLVRRPSSLFVSLGAAIILLALAVDPFTQQVLQFQSCPVPMDGLTAIIVRTNNYSRANDTDHWIDPKMTAALYQGMLNPPSNASAAMSTYCPSGNCTFPSSDNVAYSSLAICSSVDDISGSVTGNGSVSWDPVESYWHYTLPSSLNITSRDVMTIGGQSIENDTFRSPGYQPLFVFEALMVTTNCSKEDSLKQRLVPCSIKPLAVRVSLSPCVLVYGNVSVSNTIFQEQVQSIGILANTGLGYASAGNYSSFPETDCSGSPSSQGNKTHPTSVIGSLNNNTRDIIRCVDYRCLLYGRGDVLWYDPACIFNFGEGPTHGLFAALGDFFGSIDDAKTIYTSDDIWGGVATGDAWSKVLWASGMANLSSISNTMEAFTTSINAIIREEGDSSNSVPARGVVVGMQTCVGVRWAWLALPAVLIILALVFLVITMVQSHMHTHKGGAEEGRRPWKSSTLPLLWCGLQDSIKGRYGQLDEIEQMKDRGNEIRVSLNREERVKRGPHGQKTARQGGWVLKEAVGDFKSMQQ